MTIRKQGPLRVERHIVKVGKRRVHLRLCGSGPPLLLLHQSPRSSAEYLDLMRVWGKHFTCIAPDSPGFGQSDPLPQDWFDMDQLADAIVELLDSLALKQVAVFGIHTGAIIAVTAAARHPERFVAVAANGVAVWTPAEVKSFTTTYLWPLKPDWAGQHIQWVWQRVREQNLFFPWHAQSEENWMNLPMKSPEAFHDQAIDLLIAGDTYRAGYRAAFLARRERIGQLACPSLLIADQTDPLSRHLPRLPALPAHIETRLLPARAGIASESLAFLLKHPAPAKRPRLKPAPDHRFLDVTVPGWSGTLHLRRTGKGAPEALFIHEPGGSSRAGGVEAWGEGWALDLPGHGLSDPVGGSISLATLAALVLAVVAALGSTGVTLRRVVTRGTSAALLLAIAGRDDLPRGLKLEGIDAALPPEADAARWRKAFLPDRTARSDGTHLISAWQAVHDRRLFLPWFVPEPVARRPLGDLDPQRMTDALVDLFIASGAKPCLAALLGADLDALAQAARQSIALFLPVKAKGRGDLWRPPAKTRIKLHYQERAG
jgi:haloalkane dehalogenase